VKTIQFAKRDLIATAEAARQRIGGRSHDDE
jgi:hypothetical protein